MAYFVNASGRMRLEIRSAIQAYFGDKAKIMKDSDGKLRVKILSGFPAIIDRVPQEAIESGTYGGGYQQQLDGTEFVIEAVVVEVSQ